MTVEIIRSPKHLVATREKAAEFFLQSGRVVNELEPRCEEGEMLTSVRSTGIASNKKWSEARWRGERTGGKRIQWWGGRGWGERMKYVGHVKSQTYIT